MAPYSALVPDVVPDDQRGICAGWLGGMAMLGCIFGGVVSFHMTDMGLHITYLILIIGYALSSYITVRFVPEVQHNSNGETFVCRHCIASFFNAFRSPDFFWVFISRFFIQLGSITVQENLQWYLKDTTQGEYTFFGATLANNETEAVSVLFIPLLFGALMSALTAGVLSDLWGGARKRLIYFSGTSMAICCFLFGISHYFWLDILISLWFGLGFGTFSAIDWALATDVLPCEKEFGKDMGLWNLAFTLPQVISGPYTGYITDRFHTHNPNLGWFFVYLSACIFFAIGTFLVRYIEHVK